MFAKILARIDRPEESATDGHIRHMNTEERSSQGRNLEKKFKIKKNKN